MKKNEQGHIQLTRQTLQKISLNYREIFLCSLRSGRAPRVPNAGVKNQNLREMEIRLSKRR